MTQDECARIGEGLGVAASKQTADPAHDAIATQAVSRALIAVCNLLPDSDGDRIKDAFHRTRQQIRDDREAQERRFGLYADQEG